MTNRALIEVLMIDDNRGDIVLMQEAIQSASLPYNISVARDGLEAEALEILRRQGKYAGAVRPDLIILDLKLPGKTGMEVLDEIQLDAMLNNIPIIILSSSRSELSVARSRKAPPYTCITKPSTFEGYIELVRVIETFRKAEQKGAE